MPVADSMSVKINAWKFNSQVGHLERLVVGKCLAAAYSACHRPYFSHKFFVRDRILDEMVEDSSKRGRRRDAACYTEFSVVLA